MPKRHPIRISVVVVASLLLLELTLQALALFVAWSDDDRTIPAAADAERLISCVGDSFTWGQGASGPDQSYPSQLARILTERSGDEWAVSNHGKPGRNSAQALHVVDEALRTSHPAVVCIMVGINDQWSRPERAELAAAGQATPAPGPVDGFRWEFRTLRLLRILFGGQGLFATSELEAPVGASEPDGVRAELPAPPSDAATMPAADDPLVGRWKLASTRDVAWFRPNGTVHFGETAMEWRRLGERVRLGDRSAPARAVEIRDDRVVLRAESAPPIELVAGAEPRTWMFYRAVRDESWGEVLELGRLLGAEAGDDSWRFALHRGLALAAHWTGDRELARAQLAQLVDVVERSREPKYATAAAYAANRLGEEQLAFELARDGLAHSPADPKLWMCYASFVGVALDRDEAVAELRRGIAAVDADRDARAELWVRLAGFVAESPAELAEAMVGAFAAAPAAERVTAAIANYFAHGQLSVEAVRAAATEDVIEPEGLDELLALLEREEASPVAWVPVLEHNLGAAIARCRAAGCHVLLGDYPFVDADLDRAIRRVAEREGVEIVAVHGRFPRERAARDALFVADGHCNDAGYRIVAEAFADAIESLVR